MKKTKLVLLLVLIIGVILVAPTTAGAYRIGDVINYARPTNIVASINGYQLQSYNVDGYTYIVAEDLQYYGFIVDYHDPSKTLVIERNENVSYISPQNSNPAFYNISSNSVTKNILYTNILTFVNGPRVTSYNIDGFTIIPFDELACFGEVSYNDSKREISLYISDMNFNQTAIFTENYGEIFEESLNKWIDGWTNSKDYKCTFRALGDTLVADVVSYDFYNVSEREKRQIQQDFNQSNAEFKEEFAWLIEYIPNMRSVRINIYEGDLDTIASTEMFYR